MVCVCDVFPVVCVRLVCVCVHPCSSSIAGLQWLHWLRGILLVCVQQGPLPVRRALPLLHFLAWLSIMDLFAVKVFGLTVSRHVHVAPLGFPAVLQSCNVVASCGLQAPQQRPRCLSQRGAIPSWA